jgi:polar amino acid transport system substrate-binding protein
MVKLFTIRIILIMTCWCVLSFTCAADSRLIQIRSIAIPPYAILDGQFLKGIYAELANRVAEQSGYEGRNLIAPYARIIEELKTGQTDLTIMFKYQQLADYVVYLAPLPTLDIVVLGSAGTNFESVASLKGKKLAYLRGAKFSEIIDNESGIIRQDTTDFLQGINMLRLGRVDAIIGPIYPILFVASKLSDGQLIFGKPLSVAQRTPWLQMSKKTAHLFDIEKIKNTFLNIMNRGEFDVIRNKYVQYPSER